MVTFSLVSIILIVDSFDKGWLVETSLNIGLAESSDILLSVLATDMFGLVLELIDSLAVHQ